MNRPVDERYEVLSARVRDALRNRQRVRDVMTEGVLLVLQERRQAYSEALELYNQGLRESIRNKRESLKLKVLEQAERDGVDLPEEVAEDYGPTSQAIRCQFYLAAFSDNLSAQSYWKNLQEKWFAHPKFDRDEYNNLLSLYFPSF